MRHLTHIKHLAAVSAIILISSVFLHSCGKKPELRADYIVPVTIKETADSEAVPYGDIKAYAFYRDTTNFKVENYEQAIGGRMTEVATNGTVVFDVEGEYDRTRETVVFPNIVSSPITLVVCDITNELYAYSEKEPVAGLSQVTVPLLFEPYRFAKTGSVIDYNGWKIRSSPRPEPDEKP